MVDSWPMRPLRRCAARRAWESSQGVKVSASPACGTPAVAFLGGTGELSTPFATLHGSARWDPRRAAPHITHVHRQEARRRSARPTSDSRHGRTMAGLGRACRRSHTVPKHHLRTDRIRDRPAADECGPCRVKADSSRQRAGELDDLPRAVGDPDGDGARRRPSALTVIAIRMPRSFLRLAHARAQRTAAR